ncbi:MAG: DDE-type integrase/transposase/recombinase [Geminicoccaceae bacterium]
MNGEPYALKGARTVRGGEARKRFLLHSPLARGFLYLVATMDWRLSNTMEAAFCVDALEEALARHGEPEIFSSDQDSQFTSFDFTQKLKAAGIRTSMDGKGRWLDNMFVERPWRSLK